MPIRTPEVCLTPKILPAYHALGRYDPKSDRIYFSSSEFFDYDSDTRRYAVYHEIGHWFRQKRVPIGMIRKGWKFGSSDGEEGFADVFALYFMDRHGLKKAHCEYEKTIEKYMSGDEGAVEKFAEIVIAELGKRRKGDCKESRCVLIPAGSL